MIGPNNSDIALTAASRLDIPPAICRVTPSTMTMASSTTMPIASTSANRLVVLTVKPIIDIAANAPMMVTGTVVAGTSIARQSCRNSRITTSTSTAAMNSVS